MIRIQFDSTGLPEEVLKVVEVDPPQPKADELLIRVTARNINPSDIMFIQGMYGIQPRLPASAGFEACGVVEKSDAAGSIPVGTRVAFAAIGTWQEYICLPAHTVIPMPDAIPVEVACQAFVNPMTAYAMLERSGLKEGDSLLLTAAASAFSKLVIQLAVDKGIKIIGTVRNEEQKALLKEMGSFAVINTEQEKLPRRLFELIPEGVKVVFDAVGGSLGAKALSCLGMNGKMIVYGLLSLESIPMNSGLLIFKNLSIEGFWLSEWMESLDKKERSKAFNTVLTLLGQNKLKVPIEASFPLKDVHAALSAYQKSGRNGKILLTS